MQSDTGVARKVLHLSLEEQHSRLRHSVDRSELCSAWRRGEGLEGGDGRFGARGEAEGERGGSLAHCCDSKTEESCGEVWEEGRVNGEGWPGGGEGYGGECA